MCGGVRSPRPTHGVTICFRRAEAEGQVISVCEDIPRSFLLCDHPYHRQIVYLSQLNTATLQKRAESWKEELE